MVTYVGWYVLAALLLAAGVVFWVEIHRRKEGADQENLATTPRGKSQDNDPPRANQGNRIYGGAAIGAAVRRHATQKEANAVFVAAEGEVALALEETVELKRQLWDEWPYLTPELEEAIPDWREKTTDFVGKTLGSGQRAAFRAASVGSDAMIRLEAEEKFLADLARNLTPSSIRVNEEEFLAAREIRRRSLATKFLDYDHFRAPGAPPPANLAGQLDSLIREGKELVAELSTPVQPERLNWVSKIKGGGPPAEWQEKADAFRQRSMDLLEARHPALATDLRDGVKKHFEMEREAKEKREREAKADTRSDAEKTLALANFERSGPRREVEAWLEGLALARKSI